MSADSAPAALSCEGRSDIPFGYSWRKRRGTGPVFMLVGDGNYDSSLLLLDKLWDEQAGSVRGDLVAAVPSRSVLLFTGSASPDGVGQLRKAVDEIFTTGDHVVSKALLIRRNGRWEELK